MIRSPAFSTLALFKQAIPNSTAPLSPFKDTEEGKYMLKFIQTSSAWHFFHYIAWYFIPFNLDESRATHLNTGKNEAQKAKEAMPYT